jgi:hypothetical protein
MDINTVYHTVDTVPQGIDWLRKVSKATGFALFSQTEVHNLMLLENGVASLWVDQTVNGLRHVVYIK